jgi:hypothetical protein
MVALSPLPPLLVMHAPLARSPFESVRSAYNRRVTDQDALLWNHVPPPAATTSRRGESLFAFSRVSDGTPMTYELRFHRESCGWEALFRDDGEMAIGRGGFATPAASAPTQDRTCC